jgi:hypothetical protein
MPLRPSQSLPTSAHDTGAGFRSRYFKRRLPVENWQTFAKPPVCFFRVAKNILSQRLNPRQPHDTI